MTDPPVTVQESNGGDSAASSLHIAVKRSSSLPRSMGRIAIGLSAITLGAKIFGFAEKLVIAHYLGTSSAADVYFAVMGIFFSIVFLTKELIYPSLLPVFTQALARSSDESGCLFKRTFWMVTVALTVLGIVLIVGAPSLSKLFVPGFSETRRAMTALLLRLLIPGMIGLSLISVTTTILNAHGKFWVAAVGEAGIKFFMVVGLALLLPLGKMGVIPLMVDLAAIGGLMFHLCYLDERKALVRSYSYDLSVLKDMLLLMGPLVVGVVFSHLSDLTDNFMASRLPTGQLACLNYAKKMTDALLLIGPVCMVTVVYPRLSQLASRQRREECRQLLRKTFKLLLCLCVPIACLVFTLRQPLVQCLFEHGRFDGRSTGGTADALMIYSSGFVTFSLESLVVYSFFALSDTKTPVTLGILSVIGNIPLAIVLSGRLGYLGLAVALVIIKTIKVGVLGYLLSKRYDGLWTARDGVFFLKLIVTVVLLAGTIRGIGTPAVPGPWMYSVTRNLLAPALAGLIVFLAASFLLRIEEVKWVFHWIGSCRKPETRA